MHEGRTINKSGIIKTNSHAKKSLNRGTWSESKEKSLIGKWIKCWCNPQRDVGKCSPSGKSEFNLEKAVESRNFGVKGVVVEKIHHYTTSFHRNCWKYGNLEVGWHKNCCFPEKFCETLRTVFQRTWRQKLCIRCPTNWLYQLISSDDNMDIDIDNDDDGSSTYQF